MATYKYTPESFYGGTGPAFEVSAPNDTLALPAAITKAAELGYSFDEITKQFYETGTSAPSDLPALSPYQANYQGKVIDVLEGESIQQAYDRASPTAPTAFSFNRDASGKILSITDQESGQTREFIPTPEYENTPPSKQPSFTNAEQGEEIQDARDEPQTLASAIRSERGGLRTDRSLGGKNYKGKKSSGGGTQGGQTGGQTGGQAGGQTGAAPSSMDIITDPVTGNMYARDLSIPGSTYKPYTPQPQAPVEDITSSGSHSGTNTSTLSTLDDLLNSYGFEFTESTADQFKIAPAKSWKEIYNGMLDTLGTDAYASKVKELTDKVGKLDQELADKIADVNEDPWLTEGVRQRKIQQLNDRYDLKRAPYASNLELYQEILNDSREEARYIATQSLTQYNQERQFQLDQIEFMADQAERRRLAKLDLFGLAVDAEDKAYTRDFDERKFQESIRQFDASLAEDRAKRLSGGTTPVSGYNGEFQATIDLAANLAPSVFGKGYMKNILQTAIAGGDYTSAYQGILQSVASGLTGENRTKFNNAVIDQTILKDLATVLQAYEDAGGDTNIFKGSLDNIAKNIGVAINDPRYTEIATQLDRVFQAYRQNLTGAAFSEQESREYARINPTKSRSIDLNLSTVRGAYEFTNSYVEGAIRSQVGEGGIYIKEYAQDLLGTAGIPGGEDFTYEDYLREIGGY